MPNVLKRNSENLTKKTKSQFKNEQRTLRSILQRINANDQ